MKFNMFHSRPSKVKAQYLLIVSKQYSVQLFINYSFMKFVHMKKYQYLF